MSPPLSVEQCQVSGIDDFTAGDCFRLLERHFHNVDKGRFLADLSAKDLIFLLRDGESGELKGFSTQVVLQCSNGARVVFSGDTIIAREAWGRFELPRAWGRWMESLRGLQPNSPLYWMLISKGHRTYRYLPGFFLDYAPGVKRLFTPEERRIVDEIGGRLFGTRYCLNEFGHPVVTADASSYWLREHLTTLSPERERQRHISWFEAANRSSKIGEELVCITHFTPHNLKPYFRRLLGLEAPRLSETVEGAADSFVAGASSARSVQLNKLHEILRENQDCPIGRALNFSSISSVEDFRSAVGLNRYEDLLPLSPREQGSRIDSSTQAVSGWIWTSGSTSAAKAIPITPALTGEFSSAVRVWLDDMNASFGLERGLGYWVAAPRRLDRSFSAVNDDFAYLDPALTRALAGALVFPEAPLDQGFEPWASATLSTLLRTSDLRWLSFWSPSLLIQLLEYGLATGAATDYRNHWPNLALISCWSSGWSKLFLPRVRELLPHAVIQEKGLLLTEAIVTIPLMRAGGGDPVLTYNAHFYEFLPVSGGQTVLGDETKVGEEYEVIVTTGGGLYRYRTGDRVLVTDFVGEAPRLRFLGKDSCISSICGEKLTEQFIFSALERIAQSGTDLRGAFLTPQLGCGTPYYQLTLRPEMALYADEVARRLDKELSSNPHYSYCRTMRQLGPIRVVLRSLPENRGSTVKEHTLRVSEECAS